MVHDPGFTEAVAKFTPESCSTVGGVRTNAHCWGSESFDGDAVETLADHAPMSVIAATAPTTESNRIGVWPTELSPDWGMGAVRNLVRETTLNRLGCLKYSLPLADARRWTRAGAQWSHIWTSHGSRSQRGFTVTIIGFGGAPNSMCHTEPVVEDTARNTSARERRHVSRRSSYRTIGAAGTEW